MEGPPGLDRSACHQAVTEALGHVGAIDAALRLAEGAPTLDRPALARRFRAIAQTGTTELFVSVQEIAELAEKVTDEARRGGFQRHVAEVEVIQHATDVLSLLLRDIGNRLQGRCGASVDGAADVLRRRLEHLLDRSQWTS